MTTLQKAEAADHALAEEMDRLVIVKSTIYTSGSAIRESRSRGSTTRASSTSWIAIRACRACRSGRRCSTSSSTASDPPRTCCRARALPRRTASAKRSSSPACSTTSPRAASSAPITATGRAAVEPYVDEEVAFAIRYHQVLRFYPDESVGYHYPESTSGSSARTTSRSRISSGVPDARDHKWYMTARLLTVNDLYAFDPSVHVELEEFTDIVGRHFRQPEGGPGLRHSPSAHMWRTINWPTRYL